MNFEKLLDVRNKSNEFMSLLGIKLLEIEEGYAKGQFEVTPKLLNPIGSVHGGCLFTLADCIGGTAAVSHGNYVTTVSGNFNFLLPVIDTKYVTAIAKELKYGKKILVYDVELYNDDNKMVAKGTFSFYNLNKPFILD